MARQKTPLNEISHTILSSCIAMLLSRGSSPPFSKTFLNSPITKEVAEGWEKGQEKCEGERSGLRVTVALPLHLRSIGDSSVWPAVFVLYCYW